MGHSLVESDDKSADIGVFEKHPAKVYFPVINSRMDGEGNHLHLKTNGH